MMEIKSTKRKKSIHYTIRLDEEIYQKLENEAKNKGIALSSLINHIMKKYSTSYRYFDELGFLTVDKKLIKCWLDEIDDDVLRTRINEISTSLARKYIAYFFHQVNLNTLLQFLEIWFGEHGSFRTKTETGTHSFVINHNISLKYSIFLEGIIKSLINSVNDSQVTILEITPDLISFSFNISRL